MVEPFLKWAGGKRWLVKRYENLLPIGDFDRYIEPFLGSGAMYFYLAPKKALLSDRNQELIETYQQIKSQPGAIAAALQWYQARHSKKFYYAVRSSIPRTSHSRAARFLYLNRVCFNGIYRVNRRGEFNVPLGSKNLVAYPPQYLDTVARHLSGAKLQSGDFGGVVLKAKVGDFIYVDPPYTVSHNNNGFIKYNQVLFSWDDQIRLARVVCEAAARGAKVFVSNADHPAICELYKSLPFHFTLSRKSVLSGTSAARRPTSEAAFLSYKPRLAAQHSREEKGTPLSPLFISPSRIA